MSMQYPLADMLTRIRNAARAKKHSVVVSFSVLHSNIMDALVRGGYINKYVVVEDGGKKSIEVVLKYYQNAPVISDIQCVSKPSLRIYKSFDEITPMLGGMGTYIVSTSKGVFSDHELRDMLRTDMVRLGGEVMVSVV